MSFPSGGSVLKKQLVKAEDTVSIPSSGRSHMLWSDQAHEPQLLSLCSGPQDPQLLSPHAATTEAQMSRAIALKQEKPPQ